jgi:Fe-S cluster assembly protein SufD
LADEDNQQMTNQPRIVIRRSQPVEEELKKFFFDHDLVRKEGLSEGIQNFRNQAWNKYTEVTFPDERSESWKRSSLRQFPGGEFSVAKVGIKEAFPDGHKSEEFIETEGLLQLKNGYAPFIKLNGENSETVFCDLESAEKKHFNLVEKVMGKLVDPGMDKFSAAAASFAQFGSFLYVPVGKQTQHPFMVSLEGAGDHKAFFSHHLVILEPGSRATLVLENISPEVENGTFIHSGLVEIIIGAGAHLNLIELQSWGKNSWNFEHARVKLDKDATLDWTIGSLGGKFSKVFSEIDLSGQGSTGKISGFYFADGNQLLDHETRQDHMAANTTSDLLFKGALTDKSQTVWRGMIYVSPQAVKTDGYQANRNLILSDGAKADSIPGLEILTDDVRCTHGATVGKIDQDLVFYLESRGIEKPAAEQLIVEGFFEPVLERIPLESVRERFTQAISKKMAGGYSLV